MTTFGCTPPDPVGDPRDWPVARSSYDTATPARARTPGVRAFAHEDGTETLCKACFAVQKVDRLRYSPTTVDGGFLCAGCGDPLHFTCDYERQGVA